MAMRGIDISNWQKGINPAKMPIDFCICKATEEIGFVDSFCDNWIEQCKKASIPWGFYHFAGNSNPVKEADFFVKNCKGYFGYGIPVLDYEVENSDNVSWCEKFIARVHDLTGIWCMIYLSAYRLPQYKGSWIPEKCGLWVAGYPVTYAYWPTVEECPYSVSPWEFAAIWQFSSQVILPGYVGKLDGDIAYMNEKAWAKYATSGKKEIPTNEKPVKSIDELVKEVLAGKYGNGDERKSKLGNQYESVQKRIDALYNVADDVIAGKWGNGWNRQQALNGAGYPYELVQIIVNEKLADA